MKESSSWNGGERDLEVEAKNEGRVGEAAVRGNGELESSRLGSFKSFRSVTRNVLSS